MIDIKETRQKLGLTQEDFAHLIGVSFSTVNRWEQGHTKPSRLALDKINELVNGSNSKTATGVSDNRKGDTK